MANSRKSNSIEVVTRDVEHLLKRCVSRNQRVAIAFSGGLDSSVLLHCAVAICEKIGIVLTTIHVHHRLSSNADLWAAHCEQQAGQFGVDHTTIHVNVDHDCADGLEASARQERYAAFTTLNVDWIMLAHHLDDQAETVMHNLLRGSGVRGMAGMLPVRSKFLRPLLATTRQQLHDYAVHFGLTWCEDESNDDLRFTRNYIRNTVMPMLKLRHPAASTQIAAAAQRLAEAQELLDDLARIDAGAAPHSFPFPVATLVALNPHRACNLLRYLLALANQQSPIQARLTEFVRQVREAGPDRHPQLDFGGCRLRVKHRQILMEPRSDMQEPKSRI